MSVSLEEIATYAIQRSCPVTERDRVSRGVTVCHTASQDVTEVETASFGCLPPTKGVLLVFFVRSTHGVVDPDVEVLPLAYFFVPITDGVVERDVEVLRLVLEFAKDPFITIHSQSFSCGICDQR